MEQILKKLTSRKLWAAIIGVLAGLAMVFGLDENTMNTACGAVVTAASLVTYIVTEGKVDAKAVTEKLQAFLKEAKEQTDENL